MLSFRFANARPRFMRCWPVAKIASQMGILLIFPCERLKVEMYKTTKIGIKLKRCQIASKFQIFKLLNLITWICLNYYFDKCLHATLIQTNTHRKSLPPVYSSRACRAEVERRPRSIWNFYQKVNSICKKRIDCLEIGELFHCVIMLFCNQRRMKWLLDRVNQNQEKALLLRHLRIWVQVKSLRIETKDKSIGTLLLVRIQSKNGLRCHRRSLRESPADMFFWHQLLSTESKSSSIQSSSTL